MRMAAVLGIQRFAAPGPAVSPARGMALLCSRVLWTGRGVRWYWRPDEGLRIPSVDCILRDHRGVGARVSFSFFS